MIVPVVAAAFIGALGAGALSYATLSKADTTATTGANVSLQGAPFGDMKGHAPGVMGKVTAIDGSKITITSGENSTYVVDAGSAQVLKHSEVSSTTKTPTAPTIVALTDIKVGDMIMVRGAVTGTVTATQIMTGTPPMMSGMHKGMRPPFDQKKVDATSSAQATTTTQLQAQ